MRSSLLALVLLVLDNRDGNHRNWISSVQKRVSAVSSSYKDAQWNRLQNHFVILHQTFANDNSAALNLPFREVAEGNVHATAFCSFDLN